MRTGGQAQRTGLELGRRDFLKLGGGAIAYASADAKGMLRNSTAFPPLPAPADLASMAMEHRFTDLFNMPAFANEWGYGQASKSVSGVTGITFPPYACCGVPDVTWSPGLLTSCEIVLDGLLISIAPPPFGQVLYKWLPQRVDREQTVQGIRFRTRTFMPVKQRAVAEQIEVTNVSNARRKLSLGFNMRAAVTKKTTPWMAGCPGEGENKRTWDGERSRITFDAQHSAASSAQGISPRADRLEAGHVLVYDFELTPGETRVFQYVNAVAETSREANERYDRLQSNFSEAIEQNERSHADLLKAVFTPNNSFFSGHLPELHTNDEALWNLYIAGIRNLISARRYSPDSKYGPTYITLTGHTLPTLSFPWDTSLTGLSLALLDPLRLRQLVEVWLVQDMHQHLATDYVSGTGVGPWYAVNDMAILRCARDYLRVTGDYGWLDAKIEGTPVLEHFVEHALYWETLQHTERGLADYGRIENLLEVVSTYLHEVAGMNAGNVSSMRFVADLLDRRGDHARAGELRKKSRLLADRINHLLYVQGGGWWRCGQLDGTFNEVRHCYDFLAVTDNMADDLNPQQRAEMMEFFWQQLRSEKWMRALASGDPDATWNIRPDHSCLGAYASWPPMCAKALYKLGMAPSRIAPWLRELARAGNQGPIGQAHFTEDVFPPFKGAAYKCPNDPPYINEWGCVAGGAFTDLVIDTIFGVRLTLDSIAVDSHLMEFDRTAALRGLHFQGKEYVIASTGADAL